MDNEKKTNDKISNDEKMLSFIMNDDTFDVIYDVIHSELEHMDSVISDNIDDNELLDGVGECMHQGISILNKLQDFRENGSQLFRIYDFTEEELKFLFDTLASYISFNDGTNSDCTDSDNNGHDYTALSEKYDALMENYTALRHDYNALAKKYHDLSSAYSIKTSVLNSIMSRIDDLSGENEDKSNGDNIFSS